MGFKESRIRKMVIEILIRMIRDDMKKCCISVLDATFENEPKSYSRFFTIVELDGIESFLEEYAFHCEDQFIKSMNSNSGSYTSVAIIAF